MIYALFHLGSFVKFYLNYDSNDKNFMKNLIGGLGGNIQANDCQLIAYKAVMRNDQSFFFDTDAKIPTLVFTASELMDIEIDGEIVQRPVMKSVETFAGEMVFPIA